MRKIRSFRLVQRVIAGFMAMYLFNFSIDTRDAHPDHIAEDLTLNDIESIFEFSLECILGIHNAVAEHDERDQDHAGSFDFSKILYSGSVSSVQAESSHFIQFLYSGIRPRGFCPSPYVEINSPPPRA